MRTHDRNGRKPTPQLGKRIGIFVSQIRLSIALTIMKLVLYLSRKVIDLKAIKQGTKLGISKDKFLSPTTPLVNDKTYVVINFMPGKATIDNPKNPQDSVILNEYGRIGCYGFAMGSALNPAGIRKAWANGAIGIVDGDEFPAEVVDAILVSPYEKNPLVDTGFKPEDFTMSEQEDLGTLQVHNIPAAKSDKALKDFDYNYYKRFREIPPVATEFNAEAFGKDFDAKAWIKDNSKRK